MGNFAGLLKASGYEVRGSDENVYPPMSTKLQSWGIEIRKGYRPEHLEPLTDLYIVGNVIRRTNPEAQSIVKRDLKYTSFPKALGELFLEKRHSVVVAGTHGKTTTSSLVAWLLTSAGRDPGMLIGGVPGNFDEGFREGTGEHFVVEGDEYDTAYFDKVPKFVHYHPKSLFLTSLEFDHADIYDCVETIEAEFDKVVALVPSSGHIYACASAPRVMARVRQTIATVISYTARDDTEADWCARAVTNHADGARFDLVHQGQNLGTFEYTMSGAHNVENAVAAIAFCSNQGLSFEEIKTGLKSFRGVQRRQTVRAIVDGIRIIDDFAHHPTAVKETVAAIRQRYCEGRLFAIFEPRSATSSRAYFQDDYAAAFKQADQVIIAAVGKQNIPDEEKLDTAKLAAQVGGRQIADIDDIVSVLSAEAQNGDTLLFMSNGAFGGIYEKVEKALRQREG
jgi:UDP-N-acetylmuramate: L-alanyl-gamma-D-glutamyl-meso-diaminopimelate ligase